MLRRSAQACLTTLLTEGFLAGISILAARISTLMDRSPSRTARFLRRTFFQLPIPVAQPALELEPQIPGPGPIHGPSSDTSAPLRRFFAGFPRSAVARYPPGTYAVLLEDAVTTPPRGPVIRDRTPACVGHGVMVGLATWVGRISYRTCRWYGPSRRAGGPARTGRRAGRRSAPGP